MTKATESKTETQGDEHLCECGMPKFRLAHFCHECNQVAEAVYYAARKASKPVPSILPRSTYWRNLFNHEVAAMIAELEA